MVLLAGVATMAPANADSEPIFIPAATILFPPSIDQLFTVEQTIAAIFTTLAFLLLAYLIINASPPAMGAYRG